MIRDGNFCPTLMGRVLPGSIRNRVGYGFFFKKNPEVGLGFIKKIRDSTQDPAWDLAWLKTWHLKLQKCPFYIYSYILTLIG